MADRVRVAVRVRPPLEHEASAAAAAALVAVTAATDGTGVCVSSGIERERVFAYDYSFGSHTTEQLFSACVRPLLAGALDGFNMTVVAYGQTGSGKTFTMMGGAGGGGGAAGGGGGGGGRAGDASGVIPRCITELFDAIAACRAATLTSARISLLEIYNEDIIDLLLPPSPGAATATSAADADTLLLREDGGVITIPGLTEVSVPDAITALDILTRGAAHRATGTTLMNDKSSRSHMVRGARGDAAVHTRTHTHTHTHTNTYTHKHTHKHTHVHTHTYTHTCSHTRPVVGAHVPTNCTLTQHHACCRCAR